MRAWLAVALVAALSGCLQIQVGQQPAAAADAEPAKAGASIAFAPAAPKAGQVVTFQGAVRSPADGDSLQSVTWAFGDGVTAKGLQAKHAYAAAGSYKVRMVAETALSGRLGASRDLNVSAAPAGGAGGGTPLLPPPRLDPAIEAAVEGNVVSFSFSLAQAPERVVWEFGDGAASNETTPVHAYLSRGNFTATLRVMAGSAIGQNSTVVAIADVPFQPHVVVGVPDSGVNPYHRIYRRPELTMHPCTYIEGYPCGIPALNLTLDAADYQSAVAADREAWESVRPGDRYWIPGTNIIGAVCMQPYQGSNAASTAEGALASGPDRCILGDSEGHGTGTSSSVLSENPDALLVVVEGNSGGVGYLTDGTFPIDVISYSWGAAVPLLLPTAQEAYGPFFVAASGNEGAFPVVLDSQKAHPSVITVGGADGASRTEPGYSSFKTMDFVSQYCRPAARHDALDGDDEYCGTSFAAPTLAGALSRVVLEARRLSGYTGSVRDGVVDPVLGLTKWDVRSALNHTATYWPDSPFPESPEVAPLLEDAPFYQWGWGYVSRNEVPAALACLLDGDCPERDAATTAYMGALWAYRTATATA
jgi:hypothetical protein